MPRDWYSISSEIKYGIKGEKYSLDSEKIALEKDYDISPFGPIGGIDFSTTIEIVPKSTFDKQKAVYLYPNGSFKPGSVKNADVSYVRKDFSDNMLMASSYEVIAVKGDACYYLSCDFHGYNELNIQGGFLDPAKERLQKYLADIDKIVPTFELTSDRVDFNTITQSNQDHIEINSL